MRNNLKGYALAILVLVIVIAISIFALGYFTRRSVKLSSKTFLAPTVNTDETKNWKAYQNYRGQFTLKYPPNWKVEEDVNYIGPEVPNYIFIYKEKVEFMPGISIYIVPKTTVEDWFKGNDNLVSARINKIKVGNSEALEVLDIPGALEQKWVFLDKNDKTYIFFAAGLNNEITILDQILSTLKFDGSDIPQPCNSGFFPTYDKGKASGCTALEKSLVNWKKYKIVNQGRLPGISFSYPEDTVVTNSSSQTPIAESFSLLLDHENGVENNSPIISLNTIKVEENFIDWIKSNYSKMCPDSFESCTPLAAVGSQNSYQFQSIDRHYASIDSYFELNGYRIHTGMNARSQNEPFSLNDLRMYNQIVESFVFLSP